MELIQQKDGIWKGKPANPEECQGYNCFDCFYRPLWNDDETVCLAFFLDLITGKPAVIL